MGQNETEENVRHTSMRKVDHSAASGLAMKSDMQLISRVKSLSRLKHRRVSYGFGAVQGLKPIERASLPHEFRRPPHIYLNTYQMTSTKIFDIHSAEIEMNHVLDELFDNHKYSEQESPILSMRISSEILRRVKALQFNRYRYISVVTICQRRNQSYNNVVTFLWDHEVDRYVNITRENITVFVQVTIFAIYLD